MDVVFSVQLFFLCACLSVDAVLAGYQGREGIHFQFIQVKKWVFLTVSIISPREEKKVGDCAKVVIEGGGEKYWFGFFGESS